MNDSLRTDIFLRFSAETVACACIYLSARALQVSHTVFHLSSRQLSTFGIIDIGRLSQFIILGVLESFIYCVSKLIR